MASASIVFNTDAAGVACVVRIDNRGSPASLAADLGEAFGAFSVNLGNPARIGAQLIAWYSDERATVNPEAPAEIDWDDSTQILLDCSTDDGSGRPVGVVLIPSTGDESPLTYG